MTRVRVLMSVAAVAVAIGLWAALTAPPDAVQGAYSRLLGIHPPAMWVAFVAFGVTALGSIMWLIRRTDRWDRLASASAEVGVIFTAIGLFTGMVWGQAVWGTPWDWQDPRLMSTAVMFFVYIGYIALRNAIDDPVVRARRSAILGAIAVIQVPLVYFSVNLFRTLHQTQSIRPDGSTMPDEMLYAMLINMAAFSLVYVALLVARIEVAKIEAAARPVTALAGEAVLPPRLNEVEDV
ncbi:MAG TPA: cytochrome c biogenesis protein CcsA [Acidimicrobiia bacterium]|nr:cytochrome c biogenesis protein CcsA [Acidimicrobiia bacterium]